MMRHRRRSGRGLWRTGGLAVAAVMALSLVPGASAPAAGAVSDSAGLSRGSVELTGGGWGHGRGMSQWGAQGAASQGVTHQAVLSFYYPGTGLESRPFGDVRVRLTGWSREVVLAAPANLRVRDQATGAVVTGAALGGQVRLAVAGDGFLRVQRRQGSGWVDVQNPAWPAGRVSGPVEISGPATQWLHQSDGAQREYRGTITVHRDGRSVVVVNRLDLEQYLYGVVPRESPSWFHDAALRSQAVAARSYAWSNCSRGDGRFDVLDTTSCQVYGGRSLARNGSVQVLEQARTTAAVDATRHQVLRSGGRTVRAEFSSSNGGLTAQSPGAPAREDRWDGRDSRNSNHRWQQTLTRDSIAAAYPQVGTPSRVTVTARTGGGAFGGRVAQIRVEGSRGGVTVTGDQFRSALGLRSTLFGFEGSGAAVPSDVLLVVPGATTEVASARPGSGQPVSFDRAVSGLGGSDPAAWRFFASGDGGDGPPDLVGVKVRGTGSGRVEVHVLSGASEYRRFSLHAATPLSTSMDMSQWQFAVAEHRRSGDPDLFAVRTSGGASGRLEVHVLSAASGYRTWVRHAATAMGYLAPGTSTVLAGDPDGHGSLTAVVHSTGTGSGRTELHRLSAAADYQRFDLHAATALGRTGPGQFAFGWGDHEGDGVWDLFAVTGTGSGTGSGTVELHVMDGRTTYRTWSLQTASDVPAGRGMIPAVRHH
ncbi:MAG: SpoIID/LytB domain-containing protein [Kineosporiaceae bacterium]